MINIKIEASATNQQDLITYLKELVQYMENYPLKDVWEAGSDTGFASATRVNQKGERVV